MYMYIRKHTIMIMSNMHEYANPTRMAGTAPFYLSSHFNNVTHEYFTRGSMYDLDVPMPNRDIFRQSIVYQGAVAWNGLDNDLKCCNSITSFKQLYKARICM